MFTSVKCVANTEVSVSCIFCMFEIFHHCLPLPNVYERGSVLFCLITPSPLGGPHCLTLPNGCEWGSMLSCLITPSPLGGPHYLPPPQWL